MNPEAMENVKVYFDKKLGVNNNIKFCSDGYTALEKADCLAILTEWSIFRTPDFDKMRAQLIQPIIFDGRNLYDIEVLENQGFYYNSIGRKTVLLT